MCCSKIAEAEAAVSVNEKKWLVMHMHVQLKLDELRGFLQRLVLLATLALVAYGIYSCSECFHMGVPAKLHLG
jgi:hypothetical protein